MPVLEPEQVLEREREPVLELELALALEPALERELALELALEPVEHSRLGPYSSLLL